MVRNLGTPKPCPVEARIYFTPDFLANELRFEPGGAGLAGAAPRPLRSTLTFTVINYLGKIVGRSLQKDGISILCSMDMAPHRLSA